MKLETIATILGDKMYSKPLSLIVPAWMRRFGFDGVGRIIKIQDIVPTPSGGRRYETVSEDA